MPNHRGIMRLNRGDQLRVVNRLLSLKSLLRLKTSARKAAEGDVGIPARTLNKSLLVATWNLREFGNPRPKHGPRIAESFHYIAEVIAAFDVVALQEVNEDLRDFRRLMRLLGPDWSALLTDTTLGRSGNGERAAFVYDRRKVHFEGFASHVLIPPEQKVGKHALMKLQFARTPFVAAFRAGDLRFTLCSVHLYYGSNRPLEPRRVAEIESLARLLAHRANAEHAWSPTMIVLGDFNIFNAKDATAKALVDAGFFLPPQVATLESGEGNGKHFDQIALLSPRYDRQLRERAANARAGVVKLFSKVFPEADAELYRRAFPAKVEPKQVANYFREWRTYQLSDHRPRWIELQADFSADLLGKWRQRLQQGLPLEE